MNGELRAGARIRERDIGNRLKVSRTPVREAIQLLELEGFLVSRPRRRGCWVASVSADHIAHIYDVTAVLEGFAASLAADHCRAGDIRSLARINTALGRHAKDGALDGYMALNFEFHEAIHRLSGNDVLIAHLNQIKYRLYRYRMFAGSFPGRMLASFHEHERIIDALRQGDGRQAEDVVKEHITGTKDLLVRHFALSNTLLGTSF